MSLKFTNIGYALGIFWLLIYIAFTEGFGDAGFLFFLIHTPTILFIIPMLLWVAYVLLFKREIHPFPFIIISLIIIHLNIFSGRIITTRSRPETDAQHSTHVRICSWNTAYFFKWGKEAGLQRLKDANCDFILLQEVWKSETMTQEIANVRDKYFPNFDFYSQGEFLIYAPKNSDVRIDRSELNGFFSLTTHFQAKPIQLTSIHLWNPITALPTLKDGTLTTVPAPQARREQKLELLEFVKNNNNSMIPSVFVGDFNTMQNGKIIRDLTRVKNHPLTFISTPIFKSKNTYSTRLPIIHIDFAYITKSYQKYSSLQTSCQAKSSDHCLLIIDLML